MSAQDQAKAAFMYALAAVDPTRLVKRAIREGLLDDWFEDRMEPRPIHVIAIGKAAPRMVWGLVEANVPFSGIGVAPGGVAFPQLEGFHWHKGEHPVPGKGSFAAGNAVQEWVDRLPPGAHVLALVSGGASACLEASDDEAGLVEDWKKWLGQSMPTGQMNKLRSSHSKLKGGKLGRKLLERATVRAWVLSDTADGATSVASAPFFQSDDPDAIPHRVLADWQTAVASAGDALAAEGLRPFQFPHRLDGPLRQEVEAFMAMADDMQPGDALVGGAEPMLAVGSGAPPGGRCQHAALQAAHWLALRGAAHVFLAGATDGVDGTTPEAGACVAATDAGPGAQEALVARDAHRFLSHASFRTGPTGTNVSDIWIAVVQ